MGILKIIFISGPRRVGKTTALEDIDKRKIYIASDKLKDMVHRLFDLDVDTDSYDDIKDKINSGFYNKTPRECYKQLYKGFLRPLYGEGILGELLALEVNIERFMDTLDNNVTDTIYAVIGINAEIKSFLNTLRKRFEESGIDITIESTSVTIISLRGGDYTGDDGDREFINLDDESLRKNVVINNNGSIDDLKNKLKLIAKHS